MKVINTTTLERLPDHPDIGTTGTATISVINRLNNINIDNMVAIGYRAGNVSSGGSGTILIGANVQAPNATAQNQLNIGNWIYGNDGNIGIGMANPTQRFEILGSSSSVYPFAIGNSSYVPLTSGSRLVFGFGSSTGNTYARIFSQVSGGASIGNLVLADNGGNVGIGTTSPTAKLDITGTIKIADGTQ